MLTLPDSRGLVASLISTTCPACGGPKRRSHTLCLSDYRRLPTRMREALYDGIGAGYEAAVTAAFERLGVPTFTMPPPKAAKPRGLFDV